MRSIYGILFGTLFIVFIEASFLDKAISFPDDPQALFNAGTELYLQDDYSKATIFLERAKKCCDQKPEKDLKVQELAEKISLNLAHSLVKAEKHQEALAEYKDLFCKFKNAKAEKNIPILEKFLQHQEQQDKQNKNDQEQNQDPKDQDLKDQDTNQDTGPEQNQDNSNKRPENRSDQSKNDFDKKKKQEKNQKFDKDQDQKEEIEQEQQKDKQKENDPDGKQNQEHTPNQPNDSINSKKQNQNKQKIANQQLLDKDEQALLQAIENFDQDMMKMYAAANCGGDEEDGW